MGELNPGLAGSRGGLRRRGVCVAMELARVRLATLEGQIADSSPVSAPHRAPDSVGSVSNTVAFFFASGQRGSHYVRFSFL